jgi:hypothetical protein
LFKAAINEEKQVRSLTNGQKTQQHYDKRESKKCNLAASITL